MTKRDRTNQKKTNEKLVENTTRNIPSPAISRTKSLIKPPPPRLSWELLLDDYLKDPSFQSATTLNPSSPTLPTPPPTVIPSYYQSYSQCLPCQTQLYLPPRRYQMALDELVHLISQVGRCDLYREMVQYIKTQPAPLSSNPNAFSAKRSINQSHASNKKRTKY
ncbi:unnamed protein product [Adineta ricciae]|uniref:Uncharacterized protein n=1 Tax=Adineta ricciae TaxID=249248 RepID=A0A814MEM0_ADIRI|nr:unnamed protein product [Adineta ricciae]CAF1262931.1 unnamed protein product [Adineta ricciae]